MMNGTVVKDVSYTFGVGVINAGGKPQASKNFFGLLLKDAQMNTFDGNLRIQGLNLKSLPFRVANMGWSDVQPQSLSTISIKLQVLHFVAAGIVTAIKIISPEGVMYDDPDSLEVTPEPLPLADV